MVDAAVHEGQGRTDPLVTQRTYPSHRMGAGVGSVSAHRFHQKHLGEPHRDQRPPRTIRL